MTREEAIAWLNAEKESRRILEVRGQSKLEQALDMAIEALQTIDNCDQCEWCCPSDGTPTIHVVRCKDCRWCQNDYMGTWCGRFSGVRFTNADDFCSHGERREP